MTESEFVKMIRIKNVSGLSVRCEIVNHRSSTILLFVIECHPILSLLTLLNNNNNPYYHYQHVLTYRQEVRMNENRDVTSFLVSRLNQALMSLDSFLDGF